MKSIFTLLLLVCINAVYADPLSSLTLTNTEMQKLKKYFPVDEGNQNHLVWKGDPLTVMLPLNKEKRLVFSDKVTVDLKGALTTDELRLLNDNKSLYLTALKPFQTIRMFVTAKETGEVIFIDLIVNDHASSAVQYIDIVSQSKETTDETSASLDEDVSYVDLIRFAWQQLYSPRKLKEFHFARAAMKTNPFVSGLIYGDKVYAVPIASWTTGMNYVTAVVLRNKYAHNASIHLDKDICGAWLAASLYPRSHLAKSGDKKEDSTTLFLVSDKPFGDVLKVCYGNAQN